MANEENIINYNKRRSTSEARENGKKGGIASGVSRNEKIQEREAVKTFFEELKEALNAPALINGKEATKEQVALAKFVQKIGKEDLSVKDYIAAFRLILEYESKNNDEKRKAEIERIKAETEYIKARITQMNNEDTTAYEKLDEILKGIRDNAINDKAE